MHNEHALAIVKFSQKHHENILQGHFANSVEYKTFLGHLKGVDSQYADGIKKYATRIN